MENRSNPAEDFGDALSHEDVDRLIVKPLTQQVQCVSKENERLLNGLLFAVEANFESTEKQIIERLKEIEASLEIIARELASRTKLESGDLKTGQLE